MRVAVFIVLVVSNLALALADASDSSTRLFDPRHDPFWIVSAIAAAILVGTLTILFPSDVFRTAPADGFVIALTILIVVCAVAGSLLSAG